MSRKRSRRTKELQKPSEQEIFQTIVRRLEWFFYSTPQDARRDFWKRALIGIFVGGPVFGGAGMIGMGLLGLARFIPVILFVNTICCLIFPLKFHIYSKNLEKLPPELQIRWKDCLSFWSYLLAVWIGFLASVSILVGIIGFLWAKIYSERKVIIVGLMIAGYITVEAVVWLKRKDLLGAIVKPEAYPWFRPIRLFFAIPLSLWILFTAIGNIVVRGLKDEYTNFVIISVAAWGLGIALLIGGLTLIGCCIVYLYHQRCRGIEALKL